MATLEELVPQDHFLRLIDRHIDLEFIREETKHLCSADNVDPPLIQPCTSRCILLVPCLVFALSGN
jgi:hypothetical protein